ncbi:LOW QUALITY PROTEIN: hypothetical protein Cgig2_017224 [Carnegiea gigantea]|uniref:Uncharacterized protein n=1 Tax=Carnegiea gigantea TaxID=171969 RepID=A0A9Q1KFE0_9CARY|nr:LOW QUALITY PROTEIN: hypothetical protein Cgig2_017224 [Carnegiea gigantea]
MEKVLKAFAIIDFSSNAFRAETPREMGNLNALIDLLCNSNTLGGSLHPELTNLNFLKSLNLSSNKLTGLIPTESQLQAFNAFACEGNSGLYCAQHIQMIDKTSSPDGSRQNSKSEMGWMLSAAQEGFHIGLTIFVGLLLYIKRFRQCYCKHLAKTCYGITAPRH